MGGEKVSLTPEDQKLLERALMASTEKLYDVEAAPAEMQGVERAFNSAARAMQSRFGASGTEEDIEAALSEFFAPILAEKEQLEGVLARYIEEVAYQEGTDFIAGPGQNGKDEDVLYRCSGRDAEGNFTDEARAIAAAIRAQGE